MDKSLYMDSKHAYNRFQSIQILYSTILRNRKFFRMICAITNAERIPYETKCGEEREKMDFIHIVQFMLSRSIQYTTHIYNMHKYL